MEIVIIVLVTLRQEINLVNHVGLNHDIICGGQFVEVDKWLNNEFKSGVKLFYNWKYALTSHLKKGKGTRGGKYASKIKNL